MRRSATGRTPRVKGWHKTTLLVLTVLLAFVPGLAGGSASAQAAPRADMAIVAFSASPDPVFTNSLLSLQVAVENRGPSPATGVTVTTALPSSVRFEPGLSDSACTESGGVVTCSFSSWPANAQGAVPLGVTPSTAGALELTVTVSATERDPDLSNNSATETTQVVEGTETDVTINMPSTVEGFAGQNIWLGSIEVRNVGPATATGLTVTLEFPRGLSSTLGGECTQTSDGLRCSYPWGSLRPGTASLGIIGVTAAEAGTYTVRGSVTADQTDPVTENNTDATVVTANPAADLSAQIAESADPASPGTVLTYTVTITNHGPSPASSVTLTDTWSTTVRGGAQLLSFTASQGQCVLAAAGERIDCQLGGLASGANAALTVSLRPKGPGSVTDQTQASATEFDTDTANNTDSETTTVARAV